MQPIEIPSIPAECAATSIGTANNLLLTMFKLLIYAQCKVSPPDMWPQDRGEVALKEGLGTYDFIVVGAGSAGAIVANRLSEIPDWKVLLIEAGGDPPIESQVPAFAFDQLKTPVDWQFHAHPSTACRITGDQGCYLPRGKMLGGTSSMNSMNYIRGIPEDFDAWAKAGNNGWSYEDILPYFKKFEGNQHSNFTDYKNGKYHNADGPVKINMGSAFEIDKIIMKVLKEAGLNFVDDINADKSVLGYTLLQSYNFNGTRSSTAHTYLASHKNRTNLHVMKHAYVDRVLLNENNVAYGVELTYKGKHKLTIKCSKEVIVSAGTIQSPTLLLRSGIGPKKHLAERNIPCKNDLPVGENYVDHVSTFVLFKYKNITSKPMSQLILMDSLYEYLLFNKKALGTGALLTAYVDTTNSSIRLPDILYGISNFPQGTPSVFIEDMNKYTGLGKFNDYFVDANKDSAILVLWVTLVQPKSRGHIRLSETLQEDITANYLADPNDRKTLVRGINYFLNLTKSSGFKKIGTQLLRLELKECDKHEYLSDAYWDCYIKYVSNSIGHHSGTSKMGTDSKAVVDPQLKVLNTTGLRQIDCGIIPTIPRGFTNAVALMLGEKGSDLIKNTYIKDSQTDQQSTNEIHEEL